MPEKPIAYRGSEPFVFVSYAHADAELAYPIISGLQERGMRIWFDDGMDVGDIWDEVIPNHVEQCAAMLCLVSSRFADSDNCLDEIHYAKELKKELLILHLEDEVLPRNFRFRYSRFHALRLSDYSDRNGLMDKLAATRKLCCCLGQLQEEPQMPTESPEELFQKGEACYYGNGVPKAHGEAMKWYQTAAELGHLGAMRSLGYCYENGVGVSRSYEEAIAWYRRAADLGDAKAMHNLGRCYHTGNGVARSYEEAATWYRRAADKGEAAAMCNLGYLFARGQGVSQSYEEALIWYRRAADKGDATAMRNLGNCYHYGWGIAKNPMQAKYWRDKADQAETGASN